MYMTNDLKIRLKKARESAGLSQAEVAQRSSVSQPTYCDLESGKSLYSKHLVKIASALGVTAEWLSEGTGPGPQNITNSMMTPQAVNALLRVLPDMPQKMVLRIQKKCIEVLAA